MELQLSENCIIDAIKSYFKEKKQTEMLDEFYELLKGHPIKCLSVNPWTDLTVLHLTTETDYKGDIAYRGFITFPYYLWLKKSDNRLKEDSISSLDKTGKDSSNS